MAPKFSVWSLLLPEAVHSALLSHTVIVYIDVCLSMEWEEASSVASYAIAVADLIFYI